MRRQWSVPYLSGRVTLHCLLHRPCRASVGQKQILVAVRYYKLSECPNKHTDNGSVHVCACLCEGMKPESTDTKAGLHISARAGRLHLAQCSTSQTYCPLLFFLFLLFSTAQSSVDSVGAEGKGGPSTFFCHSSLFASITCSVPIHV